MEGIYGDVEGVHGATNPFYLNNPVTDCEKINMELSVTPISGYGYGIFYIYVKDTNGRWNRAARFNIEKSQGDGKAVSYEFELDPPMSFVAIAICPNEGMDFVTLFDTKFYVDSSCVSEYSNALPKPSFTPSPKEHPVAAAHMPVSTYVNPFAGASGGSDSYFSEDWIYGYEEDYKYS